MSATVLYGESVTTTPGAVTTGEQLWLPADEFAAATGWKLETEGLCRGDACVRVADGWTDDAGRVDLTAFAAHMGQPVVSDVASGTWAVGESAGQRRDALFSLEAPDFTLPDVDGRLHSLSDYRGSKVFMYSWGSY